MRAEIQTEFEVQRTLSSFAITVVITIIGIAVSMENTLPEFYLIPYILLLLGSAKVRNLRKNIARHVGYMIVRLEDSGGFWWETCLNEMRAREKHFQQREGRRIWNHIEAVIDRVGEFMETQEFTFMAIICWFLYMYNVCSVDSQECSIHVVILRIVLMLISLFSIEVIYIWSKDYWEIDEKMVREGREMWENVIEELRKNQETNR